MIDNTKISKFAISVITELQKNNFQAYLVGGCVRDSLTGITPKDFDVATNATPDQVRRIFKSSRIIGRRFKLVHLYSHNELIEMNKWVDLKRAAKISGSRFFFLKGDLARLEMALQNYTVDFLRQRGFTFVQPPVMMNRKAYEGVTDLSDFETVMYGVEPDNYYMIATSEQPLSCMHQSEWFLEKELPKRGTVPTASEAMIGITRQSDNLRDRLVLSVWGMRNESKLPIAAAKVRNALADFLGVLPIYSTFFSEFLIFSSIINLFIDEIISFFSIVPFI